MRAIEVFEVKTHWAGILQKVAQGKKFIVTKHGMPIAQIIPVTHSTKDAACFIKDMKSFRTEHQISHKEIKHMIEEGRRFRSRLL